MIQSTQGKPGQAMSLQQMQEMFKLLKENQPPPEPKFQVVPWWAWTTQGPMLSTWCLRPYLPME